MNPIFITKVHSPLEKSAVRLLIESIRTFGGEMSDLPIWIFATDPKNEPCRDLVGPQVEVFPLQVPGWARQAFFGDKVLACARAEATAPTETRALIWLDADCLVVQPPLLFDLGDQFDVALRPVHIRNVGLLDSGPLDPFWKGIYTTLGIDDIHRTVESFIDRQILRAYFNSHGLAVRPALGLFRRWYEYFEQLVCDEIFQEAACQDDLHQVFLFQAIFSALVSSSLDVKRTRTLPPTYNYPYNLHSRVPQDRRAAALNDLVCFTFEGRTMNPDLVEDVEIREPLRAWLRARVVIDP